MNEDRFDQNFVWYEWSFVSPADMPHDDLRVPSDADVRGYAALGRAETQDHDWRRHNGFKPCTT